MRYTGHLSPNERLEVGLYSGVWLIFLFYAWNEVLGYDGFRRILGILGLILFAITYMLAFQFPRPT